MQLPNTLPFSWHIERDEKNTKIFFDPDDTAISIIEIPYNISNHYFNANVYKKDCKTTLNDNDGVDIISQEIAASESSFSKVNVQLSLNAQKLIANTSTIYNGTELGGNVEFCIRQSLFLDNSFSLEKEVNFIETNLNVQLDLIGGIGSFIMADLERIEADYEYEEINYDDYVNVFHCSNNKANLGSNPSVALTQGDILNVCVSSTEPNFIQISQIKKLTLSQDGGKSFEALLSNGNPKYETLVSNDKKDECDDGICRVQVQLLAMFFSQDSPEALHVTGQVQLNIAGSGSSGILYQRRKLSMDYSIKNTKKWVFRGLAAAEHKRERNTNSNINENHESKFNIDVKIKKEVESGTLSNKKASISILVRFVTLVVYMMS